MFGFLYAPSPGCAANVRSHYQSAFCGLACQMHRDYGPLARFLINRDSTFLALAGVSLSSQESGTESRTCCNPLAPPRQVFGAGNNLSFAGAVTISGLSVKLSDNVDDERGWRARLPRWAERLIAPSHDKATAILNSSGFPTQEVQAILAEQKEIEQQGADAIAASEPTARAYGKIFAHLASLNDLLLEKSSLYQLGSSLGRLIYWQDALDDQKSDAQRGRFNPLNLHPETNIREMMDAEFVSLGQTLTSIPWKQDSESLTNIIHHTQEHHQSRIKKRRLSSDKPKKWYDHWCCCDSISCCDCSTSGCSSASDAAGSGCGSCGGCDCCSGCDCCGGCSCS